MEADPCRTRSQKELTCIHLQIQQSKDFCLRKVPVLFQFPRQLLLRGLFFQVLLQFQARVQKYVRNLNTRGFLFPFAFAHIVIIFCRTSSLRLITFSSCVFKISVNSGGKRKAVFTTSPSPEINSFCGRLCMNELHI